jgi:hypothetical protein
MASYCFCSGQQAYSSKSIIYKYTIKGQSHEDKHLIMTTGTVSRDKYLIVPYRDSLTKISIYYDMDEDKYLIMPYRDGLTKISI